MSISYYFNPRHQTEVWIWYDPTSDRFVKVIKERDGNVIVWDGTSSWEYKPGQIRDWPPRTDDWGVYVKTADGWRMWNGDSTIRDGAGQRIPPPGSEPEGLWGDPYGWGDPARQGGGDPTGGTPGGGDPGGGQPSSDDPGGGGSMEDPGGDFGDASDDSGPPARPDPLVLDLNGDGISTRNLRAGAWFDHDGGGFAEQTGWVQSDDGLLVMDRDGNEKIDNGGELFGDQTILKNGAKAANGFEALAELDENGDGRIDANDSAYSQLRVWQDNGDGLTSADELHTLDELGIKQEFSPRAVLAMITS